MFLVDTRAAIPAKVFMIEVQEGIRDTFGPATKSEKADKSLLPVEEAALFARVSLTRPNAVACVRKLTVLFNKVEGLGGVVTMSHLIGGNLVQACLSGTEQENQHHGDEEQSCD